MPSLQVKQISYQFLLVLYYWYLLCNTFLIILVQSWRKVLLGLLISDKQEVGCAVMLICLRYW